MLELGINRNKILVFLAQETERIIGNGCAASILLLDTQGLLRNGASPQLPEDYLLAIDGIKPDPNVGTCAAAAATGKVVVTPDFRADGKWAELRHLPLAIGYAGAWSMPIKSLEGKVLGTFGTYYKEIPGELFLRNGDTGRSLCFPVNGHQAMLFISCFICFSTRRYQNGQAPDEPEPGLVNMLM